MCTEFALINSNVEELDKSGFKSRLNELQKLEDRLLI